MSIEWSPHNPSEFVVAHNNELRLCQTAAHPHESPTVIAACSDIPTRKCMAWCLEPTPRPLLAVGNATGQVSLATITGAPHSSVKTAPPHLVLYAPIQERMCTMVAWNPAAPSRVAASYAGAHKSSSNTFSLLLWDVSTVSSSALSQRPVVEAVKGDLVKSFAWFRHQSHQMVVGGGNNKWLRIFDFRSINTRLGSSDTTAVHGVCVDPFDENFVSAFSSVENAIHTYDMRSLTKPVLTFPLNTPTGPFVKLAYSPHTRGCLASLSTNDNRVRFWDLLYGSVLQGLAMSREQEELLQQGLHLQMQHDGQHQSLRLDLDPSASSISAAAQRLAASHNGATAHVDPTSSTPAGATAAADSLLSASTLATTARHHHPTATSSSLPDNCTSSATATPSAAAAAAAAAVAASSSASVPVASPFVPSRSSASATTPMSTSQPLHHALHSQQEQHFSHMLLGCSWGGRRPVDVVSFDWHPSHRDGIAALASDGTVNAIWRAHRPPSLTWSPADGVIFTQGDSLVHIPDIQLNYSYTSLTGAHHSQTQSQAHDNNTPTAPPLKGAAAALAAVLSTQSDQPTTSPRAPLLHQPRSASKSTSSSALPAPPSFPLASSTLATTKNRPPIVHLASDELTSVQEVLADDLSTVMKQRALAGYGLNVERNIRVPFLTPNLQQTWKWLRDVSVLKLPAAVVEIQQQQGQSQQRALHSTDGVAALLSASPSPSQSLAPSAHNVLAFPRFASPMRSLLAHVCGWTFIDHPKRVFEAHLSRLEHQGHYAEAATLALFQLDMPRALRSLADGATKLRRENLPDEADMLALMQLALSGFVNAAAREELDQQQQQQPSPPQPKGTTSHKKTKKVHPTATSIWADSVAHVCSTVRDPHLRAALGFLSDRAVDSSTRSYRLVTRERALPLSDRIAFASVFLSDSSLSMFVRELVHEVVGAGDLKGILVTGLGEHLGDLLQRYVDRTGDCQTASLLVSLREVTPTARAAQWVSTYRDLLDTWQLWHVRAQFDIARRRCALTPLTRPSPQVFVKCNFCGTSITAVSAPKRKAGGPAGPSSAGGGAHGAGPAVRSNAGPPTGASLSACRGCKQTVPRCSVCLMLLGTSSRAPEKPAGGEGETAVESDEHQQKRPYASLERWFAWCQSCRHGGHAGHLSEWFASHSVCPVASCRCCCRIASLGVATATSE